jgi:hypothetical protein
MKFKVASLLSLITFISMPFYFSVSSPSPDIYHISSTWKTKDKRHTTTTTTYDDDDDESRIAAPPAHVGI